MLIFQPPELHAQLTKAIKFWLEEHDLDCPEEPHSFLLDIYEQDFEPSRFEDAVVDAHYILEINLPRWDGTAKLTCQQFIDLIGEIKTSKLENNQIARSNRRSLIRIEEVDETTIRFIYNALPNLDNESKKGNELIDLKATTLKLIERYNNLEPGTSSAKELQAEIEGQYEVIQARSQKNEKGFDRFCVHKFIFSNTEITCSLIKGFSIFGVLVAISGDYDK